MAGSQHVVVTGASGGIGRATVRRFAADGVSITLLARGVTGLTAAAEEVRAAGGRALPISTDVADFGAVAAAADRGEAEFGPIDVWVNSAFATVFAPLTQITPDDFRRVTEVTYLGSVHGVMVALSRMRRRDRGAIVQVGSALGKRSIPLQSAYCGAKHGVDGFVEAVRVELLHEHSGIHLTIVQAPAVNTPQFSWVRSRLPNRPQPVPPIYQPEVVADAIVFAAAHPRRKQYWVGPVRSAPCSVSDWHPRCSTGTWRGRVTRRSRPRPATPPGPATCGSPSTTPRAPTSARTGVSIPGRTGRSPQTWLAQGAESLAARLRRH